jgi:hypothetical protein
MNKKGLIYSLHLKKLFLNVLLLIYYCLFLLFSKGFVPEEAQHFEISQVARERPLKNCLDCYGVSLLPTLICLLVTAHKTGPLIIVCIC